MKDILVRRVKNGFIVQPDSYSRGEIVKFEEIQVFETIEALQKFIRKNFNYDEPRKTKT